jgi:DNA-binding NtrC family response regulator
MPREYLEVRARRTPFRGKAAVLKARMSNGTPTILVVDDESAVRRAVEGMLQREGYQVYTAESASEAVSIAERLDCGINLLVTDMHMPDTDGHQLIQAIRQICPRLGTMMMSGFVPTDEPDRDYPILSKPFTKDQLLAAVKQVLDAQN